MKQTFLITTIIAIIVGFSLPAKTCNFSLVLHDDYGDGWNGGVISLSINGNIVIHDTTLANGAGPLPIVFQANTGDTMTIQYTAGSWGYENYYYVYDAVSSIVYADGTGGTIPTGLSQGIVLSCPVYHDAGIIGVDMMECAGFSPLGAIIKNFGLNNLTSAQVTLAVNGGMQQTVNWTGNVSTGNSAYVNFSGYNFVSSSIYVIEIWTMLPNGNPDQVSSNDTFTQILTIPVSVSNFPYSINHDSLPNGFSSNLDNGWTVWTNNNNYPKWMTETADGTNKNTSGTGPVWDHTQQGNPGGKYIFLESSNATPNDLSYLTSPCINYTGVDTLFLSFWYHMYGNSMGTLQLQQFCNNSWTTIWSLSGQQQTAANNPWLQAIVPIDQNVKRVRFAGIAGLSFTSDMALDDIAIGTAPKPSLGADIEVCDAMQAFLNPGGFDSTTHTFVWRQLGLNDTLSTNPIYRPDNSGIYFVKVTNILGISGYDTVSVTIHPLPSVSINNLSANYCAKDLPLTVNVSPPGGILYGSGISGNTFNPVNAGLGQHMLVYAYSDTNNCYNTDTQYVEVHEVPVINLPPDTAACDYPTFTLNAGSGFAGYLWSTQTTTQTLTLDSSNLFYGENFISVTVTNNEGCANMDTIKVTVHSLPTPAFSNLSTDYCANALPVTVNTSPQGGVLTGNGITSGIFSPSVAGEGQHTISYVYTDSNGCTSSINQQVEVHKIPILELPGDTAICNTESITLNAGNDHAAYLWSTSATTQTIMLDSTNLLLGNNTISVTVTNNHGCENTDDLIVTMHDCTTIDEPESNKMINLFPNPNNGTFNIVLPTTITNGQIEIYDNTGTLLSSGSLEKDICQTQFSLPHPASGIYLLIIKTQNNVYYKRFMIF